MDRIRRQSGLSLPGNWSSIGCYLYDLSIHWRIFCSSLVCRDNVQGRALTGATYASATDMTVEGCVEFCDSRDYNYAGLEWYQECWCGNFIINGGAETTPSDCSFPCTGDPAQVCGAGNRLSMYYSGQSLPPAPEIVPSVGLWQSLGCYRSAVFSCQSIALSQPYPPQSATTSAVGRFPFRLGSLPTRSRAVLQPAITPAIPWPARNTLRNVGAARPFKPGALQPLLLNATWCAPAIARSIVVARIVSISTTTLVLPRLHLHLPHPLPAQVLFT